MKEHENSLIERLLVEKDSIKWVYGKITPEMFTEKICKEAYTEFIRHYDKTGKALTIYELEQRLDDGIRDRETTMAWLKSVVTSDSTASSTKGLIDVIVNEYKVRKVRDLLFTTDLKPKDIESTISNLIAEFEALKENKSRLSHSLAEITNKNKGKYFVEHEKGIRTGLTNIDEFIELTKGDVTILGARPSVGKSALATQILTSVAKKGRRVGYFNLEMNDSQIYERIVASYSGIDLNRIKRAVGFLNDEKECYEKAVKELEQFTNIEIFSGSFTASEIKHLCRNMDFELVVIDYLQIVKPDKTYGNRVAEVGDISKTIKSLAMELKIPVLALSQLNRRKSSQDEPELSDLRESGDIEQDASTILFMWNIDEYGVYKGLSIAKNRQGINGRFALLFDGSHMRFIPSNDDVETLKKAVGNARREEEVPWG